MSSLIKSGMVKSFLTDLLIYALKNTDTVEEAVDKALDNFFNVIEPK